MGNSFRIKEIESQLREMIKKQEINQSDVNVAKKLLQERHDLLNPKKIK